MNLILGTGLAVLVTGLTGDLDEPIPSELKLEVYSIIKLLSHGRLDKFGVIQWCYTMRPSCHYYAYFEGFQG